MLRERMQSGQSPGPFPTNYGKGCSQIIWQHNIENEDKAFKSKEIIHEEKGDLDFDLDEKHKEQKILQGEAHPESSERQKR